MANARHVTWLAASLLLSAIVMSTGLVLDSGPPAASELKRVHRSIVMRYPDVAHITTYELAGNADNPPIVFDVRAADEFAVSHLANAKRVPPGISAQDFLAAYADHTPGRHVVFYCSVGERSSSLAQRVQRQLMSRGAKSVRNLAGGVFTWHNERRQLMRDRNKTTAIHPYNARWSQLIENRSAIRYGPE